MHAPLSKLPLIWLKSRISNLGIALTGAHGVFLEHTVFVEYTAEGFGVPNLGPIDMKD